IIRNESWVRFCRIVLDLPELAADPRFADVEARMSNEAALMGIVRGAIAERPTAYWAERLREADIMDEKVNSFREFLGSPQVDAIGLISQLPIDGAPPVPIPNIAGIAPFAPGTLRGTAPRLGQHSKELLGEHGFAESHIQALIERQIVAQA